MNEEGKREYCSEKFHKSDEFFILFGRLEAKNFIGREKMLVLAD